MKRNIAWNIIRLLVDELFVPSTLWPRVSYWRLSDFTRKSDFEQKTQLKPKMSWNSYHYFGLSCFRFCRFVKKLLQFHKRNTIFLPLQLIKKSPTIIEIIVHPNCCSRLDETVQRAINYQLIHLFKWGEPKTRVIFQCFQLM